MTSKMPFSSQDVGKWPLNPFSKGYFGGFKGCILCLENVGTKLDGFSLPRVEVATGA